ncbi:hypothetical protein [Nocardia terpenica]|uniref:Histidine kinase n=1 Tax=Nocardia terpenica TaxID=455432 RepID=A0A6G9ZB08_9NOCA|nr:hypothetical protein [Nocardia terpenica]QIS22799.1 hypothetical protein F6W96_35150 [Nocardia terpenica]
MTDDHPPIPPSTDVTVFAECTDRMVRQMHVIALQLNTLRYVLDRDDATADEAYVASAVVSAVIGRLDTLIHDTGLTMLTVTGERAAANGNGRPIPPDTQG